MQIEILRKLEHKLRSSLLTDDDEWRFNELAQRYDEFFKQIIEYYLLEDMPQVHAQIQAAARAAHIKDYFLQKELLAEVEKILVRAAN
jgi:hypothetical protein